MTKYPLHPADLLSHHRHMHVLHASCGCGCLSFKPTTCSFMFRPLSRHNCSTPRRLQQLPVGCCHAEPPANPQPLFQASASTGQAQRSRLSCCAGHVPPKHRVDGRCCCVDRQEGIHHDRAQGRQAGVARNCQVTLPVTLSPSLTAHREPRREVLRVEPCIAGASKPHAGAGLVSCLAAALGEELRPVECAVPTPLLKHIAAVWADGLGSLHDSPAART